ncbi:Sugar kinase of the NBD/HSP70 family, may contain an N-terminal HTH domain [Amycolatopsis marina]|uniref:Sugar kinase of the NBD/HSP70 family, may contain an N-terminal HTH domain n=1 Tax=Amycolatopsis marina TaxID=490629 RepID=A0A1I1BIK6_9PSEU|nr:ROK family transcriptional regulator [Amycolatopsis marina]SFB50205.1 Sugar kinase of the NBD/HSP70 family, may contain an N-terminal HTH domain [Amycolatopsis marina]
MADAAGKGIRSQNLALLLRLVCDSSPVTRVELAKLAGLTKVTVTNLMAELIDNGLVHDLGVTQHGGPGRPASRVAPDPLGPVGIGFQVEVDHVAGCVVDLSGRIRRRELRRMDTRSLSPAEVVRGARPVLRRLFDHATTSGQLVAGIGVALPALFGRDRDGQLLVRSVPGLGWQDVDVRTLVAGELEAIGALGIDVRLGGSVPFAADVECRGSAEDLIYVGGEAEVGAALVTGGVPHAGAVGAFGHVPVHPRRGRCPCGRSGCLELSAGRAAMASAVGEPETALPRLLSGKEPFAERLHDGDRRAATATTLAARALADALAAPVAMLGPATVVLGGRLAALGDALREPLAGRLAEQHPGPRVRIGQGRPDTALQGAAWSVLAEIVDDPLGWLDRTS